MEDTNPMVTAFDWHRLLWGDAPPLFALEILFRVAVILLWTTVLLRWIGGRSISQLSIVEFLLVIALGSAVGDSLFYPDVPLAHAMLVILAVVLVDKGVDIAIRRWRPAKALIDGTPVPVVAQGHILGEGTLRQQIGTAEVMEMLRLKGICNLGQVEHAYLEPSGNLSLFKAEPPRPGLMIVPPPELAPLPPPAAGDLTCCGNCGFVMPEGAAIGPAGAQMPCPACAARRWTRASACTAP